MEKSPAEKSGQIQEDIDLNVVENIISETSEQIRERHISTGDDILREPPASDHLASDPTSVSPVSMSGLCLSKALILHITSIN